TSWWRPDLSWGVTPFSRGQRRQGRSLAVEYRLQRGCQMLELGSTHVLQEVLPQPSHVDCRGLAQQILALGGEGREISPFVSLEDASLHQALPLELISSEDPTSDLMHP